MQIFSTRGALAFLAAITCAYAQPAAAQSGEQQDSVGEDAVDAITQPLTDLNLRKKDIPPVLEAALRQPYDLTGLAGCEQIWREIESLDEVLGPDADAERESEGLVNKGLQLGGSILSGFIPFRGLVRQISGAKAQDALWEAAIYAGVARRSYLKGLAYGRTCDTPQELAIESAYDILRLPE